MTELKYDPELPIWVSYSSGDRPVARFRNLEDANRYRDMVMSEGVVIDTTPKPKIPEDADFFLIDTEDTLRDIYCKFADPGEDVGYYWFRTADRMSYTHDEVLEMIGDSEVTVLVRKEDS